MTTLRLSGVILLTRNDQQTDRERMTSPCSEGRKMGITPEASGDNGKKREGNETKNLHTVRNKRCGVQIRAYGEAQEVD